MSIPPLVCNTPPPIDQCDDDKDHEDFDLRYNLSQEDDDSNEYDYNNFTSYNNFQSTSDQSPLPEPTPPNIVDENEIEIEPGIKTNHCKMKTQDDVNLEDLDLKLDRVSVNSDKENQGANSSDSFDKESSTDISDESNIETDVDKKDAASGTSIEEDPISKDEQEEPKSLPEDVILPDVTQEILTNPANDTFHGTPTLHKEPHIIEKEIPAIESDDEFGDFDNFKAAISDTAAALNNKEPDNPWCGQDWEDKPEFEAAFGNFTSSEQTIADPEIKTELFEDDDDDFGEFDDFQSTSVRAGDSCEATSTEPVPNLSPAITEQSIEEVIFTIFEKDDSDPTSKFESKLESFLRETWQHLKETDIRQPYLVNWNTSITQKTLLKALCIDSRNILFGPKWASNTPKYAVNLGAAPLQPQKPTSVHNEGSNPEKSSSKSSDTWVDPFSSVGQEFTYAEALLLDLEHLMATLDQMAHNHSNLRISDLLSKHACASEDSLPAEPPPPAPALAAAPGIYSATLNIQPMRQISLPDTHIFTPTDSEIPRSKTIHYDNSPTIILPQRKAESLDNDFSDFQDFREAPVEPRAAIAHVTEVRPVILEPIKIEPTMPKLNWPDPGLVKETFEDFSDFISNSSWSNSNQSASTSADVNSPSVNVKTSSKETTNIAQNDFDEDFESFQSAIPTNMHVAQSQPKSVNKSEVLQSNQASVMPQSASKPTDFDFVFAMSESSSAKSNISPVNVSKSSETSPRSLPGTSTAIPSPATDLKPRPMVALTPSFSNQILQPISTGLSAAQPKPNTGQILQPLSLEGYSQINWPNPGLDLQDLSRFNPVEKLPSLKGDSRAGAGAVSGAGSLSKGASPAHTHAHQVRAPPAPDDDIWGEFVSSRPKPRPQPATPQKQQTFVDDDEWTDFVSSSSVNPPNGVNTISFNVHSNISLRKPPNPVKYNLSAGQKPVDIPTLNYITPKNNQKTFAEKHFQNL